MASTDHNKPVFSIITITFNHLKGLRRTHRSLQEQNYRDYEWIVIDGESHDGTQDYMRTSFPVILSASEESHKQKKDPSPVAQDDRIIFISEPDHGIYDAMNKGIDRASGDYILFLNAGDILAASDILEKLSSESGAAFIYGDALEERKYQTPAVKSARPHTKILHGMITHHQAMLYRREMMEDLRYDTAYKIAADYKFTLQFLQRTTHSYYYPHPICVFECGGVSQQNVRQGRREQFQIRRDLNVCGPVQNSLIYLRQALSSLLKRLFPFIYWRLRG